MKLSKDKKIRYSPLETRILENMPKDGTKITSMEMATKAYDPGEAPFNARQTILHGMDRLLAKGDLNKEPWEIFKSQRRGSQPTYFWMKKREEK
jgi:hypothetical protein